ncbi:hypothetical protein, partial [Aquipseudomonas alcaligenes]|uniref:hypothetical protein n=1 Tax=Aquipseudomonas alcaligenes TaxID=43263 RepID=UPI001C81E35C
AALRLPGRMAVEQVARWPWNAWPDESGLGGRMAWNPHFISEKRTDMYISTLRSHIEAMGGQLEVIARFPDGAVKISNFAEIGTDAS